MTSAIVGEFLQAILENCFDSRQKEKQVREKAFFQLRFNPVNRWTKEHTEIAKMISQENWSASIPTTVRNVVEAIVNTYQQEMRSCQINIDDLLSRHKGKPKEGDSPWEKVYDWLWSYKFPDWSKNKYTQENWFLGVLFENAKPTGNWIEFISEDKTRIARGGKRREEKIIDANQDYLMSLKLPYPEHHLLLLNRAGETISCMCPSPDFAPMSQLSQEEIKIPQDNAEFESIVFESPGTEEFLAIVMKQLPPKDGLSSDTLYQLWRKSLEGQANWQVFYEEFAVVNN